MDTDKKSSKSEPTVVDPYEFGRDLLKAMKLEHLPVSMFTLKVTQASVVVELTVELLDLEALEFTHLMSKYALVPIEEGKETDK